jgi:TonB-dependent receptor
LPRVGQASFPFFGELWPAVVLWSSSCVLGFLLSVGVVVPTQQMGSIRGVVTDKDFGGPLAAAQVVTLETGQKIVTTDQGNFVFKEVPPGTYTLAFSKEGYVRQVKAGVVVTAGALTDVDVELAGEFTEMDEFVVQDTLRLDAGSEASLLKLRLTSASLMDSIGADMMSRAGVGDAAAALRLVSGASVQDGKYAVIRGLPDRYVSSQMNGVVLPTADADKRAVQLDQFPSAAIESIQVTKTFTPDQQGDASGGAVNVRLKSIPEETIFQIKGQFNYNNQASGIDNFLTYPGGGVSTWGFDSGREDVQPLGQSWTDAVGTTTGQSPVEYKWSATAGGKQDVGDGVRIGGLANFSYEAYSSYFDDGQNNLYWVTHPGDPMTPQKIQATGPEDFKTALYDVTQGTQGVRWSALGTLGLESENHVLGFTYLYTHTAEDQATLSTDTRGKAYYFPGYDVHDPMGEGNKPENIALAPYVRLETLEYTERTTQTIQLAGWHRLPLDGLNVGDLFKFRAPEFDWMAALSGAELSQPDKRQFAATWVPRSYHMGIPGLQDPYTTAPTWTAYKPADNVNLGNVQHIYKDINEDSTQYALDLKFPFTQWSNTEGYMKFGWFDNHVDRTYDQESYGNFGDPNATYSSDWNNPWSTVFPSQDHIITASPYDVDYTGKERISAFYGMVDLPLTTSVNLIGGARFESTEISIVNNPDPGGFAFWFPPNGNGQQTLDPGEADVDFSQNDVLPSIGLVYKPVEPLTLRASYGQTVARQTFKELTPIVQQDFLGGPVFVGNPDLQMSELTNYDLRADYAPYAGGLFSASWFYKDVQGPIEYVQKLAGFTYTAPVNYPKGELSGVELELRQGLGTVWGALDGFAVGANATFIQSEVTLPADEAAMLSAPGIEAPTATRDMTNAPNHLYNLYLTYDLPTFGTQFGLFYTVQGDTLLAGAGVSLGNFVPSVYSLQYDTLNFTLTQRLGKYLTLGFQAKNLTNPAIQTVYRSQYIGDDVLKSTYTKGVELSVALSASFGF